MKYAWWVCGIMLLVISCSPNWPQRTYIPQAYWQAGYDTNRPAGLTPINEATNSVLERHTNYNLGFVEFDDQGWFWSHKAWQAVRTEIQNEGNAASKGFTMVVFVHGWKNNAAFGNSNVVMFRSVLDKLSRQIGPDRKVFGLYVGWRGRSVKSDYFPLPAGEELSFYHRKAVAERIGHEGAATQVFTELETLQDDWNATNSFKNRAELIVVGHSFGGQLVYSAISQILTERLVMHTRHNGPVKSFGDLVVLVNPAFEASLYNNLISLAVAPEIQYPTNQGPVLAIFESKSDDANGGWFPRGRKLNTWYEATRPSKGIKERWIDNVQKQETADERKAIQEAVGFDTNFITYDLNYTTNFSMASQKGAMMTNNMVSDPHDTVPILFPEGDYACELKPRTNGYVYKAGNPFLNVAVDSQIMNGHNDIDNPRFLDFLRNFILFAETNHVEVGTNYANLPPK